MLRLLLLIGSIPLMSLPAAAASSEWTVSEGGAVRLVTAGLSDDAGRLRGAIEIRLKPGWKTYWRSPGDAGIPPQIDVASSPLIVATELLFPPPVRIKDPYSTWAGYKHSVSLPVVFTLSEAGTAGIVEGTAFLGICESICIPVEMSFSFDAGADPDNPEHALVVEAAFDALPAQAREGFRVNSASHEGKQILFDVELPQEGGEPELFVAPAQDMRLAAPQIGHRDGRRATFTADILGTSTTLADGIELDYTLTAGDDAIMGTIRLSQ